MPYESVLAILSLAVSVGGLVPYILVRDPEKRHLRVVIGAVTITILVAVSTITVVNTQYRDRQVDRVADTILNGVGTSEVTLEQVYNLVSYGDVPLVPIAMERLGKRGKVHHSIRDLYAPNNPNTSYSVRLYHK